VAAKNKRVSPKPVVTERGENTHAKLVETAYTLFLRQGFHGTSMRDIAEGAGVAVGGIYNHFKDKEEIFAAVLDTYHPYHTIVPAVQSIEVTTVEDYVHQAAHIVYDGLSDAESQLLPLAFIELVEFQGKHIKGLIGKIAPVVWGFLDRLKNLKGPLRPLPLPLLFRTYMGLLIGLILGDMILKDLPLFKAVKVNWLDGMIDIFLHGILKPE
jgi:AcrR family transcriptional regulator